jgi:hypothetical protein
MVLKAPCKIMPPVAEQVKLIFNQSTQGEADGNFGALDSTGVERRAVVLRKQPLQPGARIFELPLGSGVGGV